MTHKHSGKITLLISGLLLSGTVAFAQSPVDIPSVFWPKASQINHLNWPTQLSDKQTNLDNTLSIVQKFKPVLIKKSKIIRRLSSVKQSKHQQMDEKIFKLPSNIVGIHSAGTYLYHIVVGKGKNFMEVKGLPSAVTAVHYQVKQGVLHVYQLDNDHAFVKHLFHPKQYNKVHVIVHLQHLNKISQNGTSSMTVRYHQSQPLKIQKWGSGNLKIKGNAIRLTQLNNNDSGNVNINRIYTHHLVVTDNGSGKVDLVGSRINLRRVTTDNSGLLKISNIRSNHLILNVNTNGRVLLAGEANASTVNFHGSGLLKMHWIKDNVMTITTHGSGTLALAGVANVINAYAYDQSHLNLRYLRAKTVFATSYHLASIDVWANDSLYALAENNSTIYYYNKPKYTSREMREAGSILPMANIPRAILTFNPVPNRI